MPKTLSPAQARAFYDRFGKKQDAQSFYEDVATADLLNHAAFEQAERVFEYGCGTGRFAQKLLQSYLPPTAQYLGCDISQTMVVLTTGRVQFWAGRASVRQASDLSDLALPDGGYDRFISTYVFDLLEPEAIRGVLGEARRVLGPDGRLCLVSLTFGQKPVSKVVSWLWGRVHQLRPQLVGGCRPIRLLDYLPKAEWRLEYHKVLTAYGISSEVVIAAPFSS